MVLMMDMQMLLEQMIRMDCQKEEMIRMDLQRDLGFGLDVRTKMDKMMRHWRAPDLVQMINSGSSKELLQPTIIMIKIQIHRKY